MFLSGRIPGTLTDPDGNLVGFHVATGVAGGDKPAGRKGDLPGKPLPLGRRGTVPGNLSSDWHGGGNENQDVYRMSVAWCKSGVDPPGVLSASCVASNGQCTAPLGAGPDKREQRPQILLPTTDGG